MSESKTNPSGKSMIAATKSRAKFSGHGNAKGAAGHNVEYVMRDECDHLMKSGEMMSVNPPEGGFKDIKVGAAWDPIINKRSGILGKLGIKKKIDVDIDLGCLYELEDGTRGALQAFGELHGAYEKPPYIKLSKDERTGETVGYDEYITINGRHWEDIKRVYFFVYIYEGIALWAEAKPEIHIIIPDKDPLIVTLSSKYDELDLCLIGGVERVRKGMRVINFTEYFPGHSEMDRAHGFGLSWEGGKKRPIPQ